MNQNPQTDYSNQRHPVAISNQRAVPDLPNTHSSPYLPPKAVVAQETRTNTRPSAQIWDTPVREVQPSKPDYSYQTDNTIRVQDSTGLNFDFKDKIEDSTYQGTSVIQNATPATNAGVTF